MSTITINTFLTNTVSREELVQAISRLPAGGDIRTEIIDDETGEVLYTCQRGQVQMTTEVLVAVLANKQGTLSNLTTTVNRPAGDWEIDDTCRLVVTKNETFRAGDTVRICGVDHTDDVLPIQICPVNDPVGHTTYWVSECDIVPITK